MHLCRKKHGVVHFRIQAKVQRYALLPYHVLMKSINIPCVIISNIRTLSNESEIRTFARRILDIPKDTHYLNIFLRFYHFITVTDSLGELNPEPPPRGHPFMMSTKITFLTPSPCPHASPWAGPPPPCGRPHTVDIK